MHSFRYSIIAATLGALSVGAQLIACGGRDEARPAESNVGDGGAGPVLTLSEARAKVYLGQTARLDGARLAPGITSGFTWKVIAAPSESTVKTEALQEATTATPSFQPDVLGMYSLQVSGTKDGVDSSVVVFVEAIDAPVFWREAIFVTESGGSEQMSLSLATHVAGAHGGGDRIVGCPLEDAEVGSGAESLVPAARIGANGGDVWEAPPGTPSRVVFPSFKIGPAADQVTTSLVVATSQSPCGAPEAKVLETLETDAGVGQQGELSNGVHGARFSPDGNRIAYLHNVDGRARLATIGFDGSDERDLSPFQSGDGGGLDPAAMALLSPSADGMTFPIGQIPPRWRDATHVGWMTLHGPTAGTKNPSDWELYVVEDKAGATAELVMRCSDSGVRNFDFLPDGSIVAAARHTVPSGGEEVLSMNLLVYRPNATTKQCEVVRNLTGNTAPDAVARDLALSPDKTQVAFFAGTGTGFANSAKDALSLFTVPVDGSRPAAQVPGSEGLADPGIGPRWVAGGAMLTWGKQALMQSNTLPIGLGQVVSIAAGGGTQLRIAEGAVHETMAGDGGVRTSFRFTYGIGQGCNATAGAPCNEVVFAGALGGLAMFVARRRRGLRSSK